MFQHAAMVDACDKPDRETHFTLATLLLDFKVGPDIAAAAASSEDEEDAAAADFGGMSAAKGAAPAAAAAVTDEGS